MLSERKPKRLRGSRGKSKSWCRKQTGTMEGRAHSVAGIQSTAASEGAPLAPCGRRLRDLTGALRSGFCCPCSQGSGAWQLSHHREICACSEGSSTLGGSPKRAPISQEDLATVTMVFPGMFLRCSLWVCTDEEDFSLRSC